MRLRGTVRITLLRGRVVFDNGVLLAHPEGRAILGRGDAGASQAEGSGSDSRGKKINRREEEGGTYSRRKILLPPILFEQCWIHA